MRFQSHITNIQSHQKLCMRNLTIEEKVLPFQSLAISKIIHLSLIIQVTHAIINQVNIIQKIL